MKKKKIPDSNDSKWTSVNFNQRNRNKQIMSEINIWKQLLKVLNTSIIYQYIFYLQLKVEDISIKLMLFWDKFIRNIFDNENKFKYCSSVTVR